MARLHINCILIAEYAIIFLKFIWQMWFAWVTPREKWNATWYSYVVLLLGVQFQYAMYSFSPSSTDRVLKNKNQEEKNEWLFSKAYEGLLGNHQNNLLHVN